MAAGDVSPYTNMCREVMKMSRRAKRPASARMRLPWLPKVEENKLTSETEM